MELWLNSVDSPLGEMMLVTDEHCRVRALEFADHESRLFRGLREHYGDPHLYDGPGRFSVGAIAAKLKRYFDGDVAALDDIQVATGGSELQRQVWAALRRIPAGRVTSYGELARSLGHTHPRVARDVGAANGANPIAIILPCHRVIGKGGDLKGYAWGLHRKRWLLEHERADVAGGQTATLPGF